MTDHLIADHGEYRPAGFLTVYISLFVLRPERRRPADETQFDMTVPFEEGRLTGKIPVPNSSTSNSKSIPGDVH